MSEIVTRLLLNTKDFDANLSRSKRGVKDYESGISSFAKTAGAGIAKFAAGLGVAMGAGEAFMKVIRGSQSTSDEFDNTLFACKGTVDLFFESLSKGDFQPFRDGIAQTISDMYELSALRDSFNDAKLTAAYNTSKFDAAFAEKEAIIRDKTKPKAEREKAFNDAKTLADELAQDLGDTANGARQVLLKTLNSKFRNVSFTMDDVDTFLSVGNNDFSTRKLRKQSIEYDNKLKELKDQQYTNIYNSGGTVSGTYTRVENKDITKQIELLKKLNPLLEKQRLLRDDNDTNRDQMYKDAQYEFQLTQKVENVNKRLTRLNDSLNANTGGSGKPKVDETKLIAADADYWIQQLNASRGKFDQKVATIKPIQIPAELEVEPIEELPKNELEITLKARLENTEFAKKKIAELQQLMTVAQTDTERNEISGMIAMWRHNGNVFDNKDIKLNNDYADSLYNIGDAMNNISGLVDNDTASVLRWGAAIFNTIGQAIPTLMSMFAVKETDTQLTNENTNANIANASSKAMAAHSGIPFVGVALGVAAIATIAAAMMSIPKFETGGIVGGNFKSGDKILARLNSGEMILNEGQQANLFRLLNSGDRIGNSVIVSGESKVRGSDIYLSLKNYMRQTNKKL